MLSALAAASVDMVNLYFSAAANLMLSFELMGPFP